MTPIMLSLRTSLSFFVLVALAGWARGAAPAATFEAETLEIRHWRLLGPVALAADAPTSVAVSFPMTAMQQPDAVAWFGRDPYSWLRLDAPAGMPATVDHAFSRARPGNAAWLTASVQCPRNRRAALSLESPGRAAVWVDGRLALDTLLEPWHTPGADRYLRTVALEAGEHRILVQTYRPDGPAPWQVRLRLIDTQALTQHVALPRWQFDSPPPWTADKPPRARWGDPELLREIQLEPTSISLTLRGIDDATTPTERVATWGRWVELAALKPRPGFRQIAARPMPGSGSEIWSKIDLERAQADHALPLGPLGKAAAEAIQSVPRDADTASPDLAAALDFLAKPHALHYDPAARALLTARRSAAFAAAQNAQDAPPWPQGWLRLMAAPPDEDSPPLPYALFLPSEPGLWSAAPPLIVVLPPPGTDEWHVLLRRPELAQAAREGATLLAVAAPPGPNADWPHPATPEDFATAVVDDIARRLPIDSLRCALIAQGASAPIAFACDRRHASRFALIAFEDSPPPWYEHAGTHTFAAQAVLRFEPGGGLVALKGALAGDTSREAGAELISYLKRHPLDPWPEAVAIEAAAPPGARRAWARVRAARDTSRKASLRLKTSENRIDIHTRNLRRFDLLLGDSPHFSPDRPVLLRITGHTSSTQPQPLRIVGPELPEAVTVRLRDDRGNAPRWELAALSRRQFSERGPDPVVAQTDSDIAAWPVDSDGGIATLAARAVREASGAHVAIVPNAAIRRSHARGAIRQSAPHSWCHDTPVRLSEVALGDLVDMVARDYAGARRLTTDGIEALAAPDETDTSSATGVAWFESSIVSSTIRLAIPTQLNSAWRALAPSASKGPPPPSLHDALLRHIDKNPVLKVPAPDVRLLPIKRADILKNKPGP